ncbi:MAG: PAS domain-containing protein [Dehalococcoidales bacterium]
MKTAKGLVAEFKVGHRDALPMPVPAIIGPLLGLGYIIVLPFIGLVSFISIGVYCARQRLATVWRRATVDAQDGTKVKAVELRDFLQPLIDRLECEFLVIDRDFRITQYYMPLLRQNKLLEQTAIGQHCFEVSHGRNSPCESGGDECPVRRVLETNEKVMATHYHKNQLEGKGRQRLVKVLASPVRDSQGNVTQVAELVWDAEEQKPLHPTR